MNKRNIAIIVSILIGCIIGMISGFNIRNQEIDDLLNQVEEINTKYEDFNNAGEILTQDFYDMVEAKYDLLLEATNSMAFDLEYENIEPADYDDRQFIDVYDDWLDRIDPYMQFIIEKCGLD